MSRKFVHMIDVNELKKELLYKQFIYRNILFQNC